jgi:hypothetical protein
MMSASLGCLAKRPTHSTPGTPRLELAARELSQPKPDDVNVCSNSWPPCAASRPRTEATADESDAHHHAHFDRCALPTQAT